MKSKTSKAYQEGLAAGRAPDITFEDNPYNRGSRSRAQWAAWHKGWMEGAEEYVQKLIPDDFGKVSGSPDPNFKPITGDDLKGFSAEDMNEVRRKLIETNRKPSNE